MLRYRDAFKRLSWCASGMSQCVATAAVICRDAFCCDASCCNAFSCNALLQCFLLHCFLLRRTCSSTFYGELGMLYPNIVYCDYVVVLSIGGTNFVVLPPLLIALWLNCSSGFTIIRCEGVYIYTVIYLHSDWAWCFLHLWLHWCCRGRG